MGTKTPESLNAFQIVELERADQRILCSQLMNIADSLPNYDRESVETAYRKLSSRLPIYHSNEDALFVVLKKRSPAGFDIEAVLNLVREEHENHVAYAVEVAEFMVACESGRSSSEFGYMFRAIFDAITLHLNWEDAVLLRLAGSCLTDTDIAHLSVIMAANRRKLGLLAVR